MYCGRVSKHSFSNAQGSERLSLESRSLAFPRTHLPKKHENHVFATSVCASVAIAERRFGRLGPPKPLERKVIELSKTAMQRDACLAFLPWGALTSPLRQGRYR